MQNKEQPESTKPLLIVIPFCAREVGLVVDNLAWVISLDQKVVNECLLAYEQGTPVEAVKELAGQYFANVHEFVYTTRARGWPQICNDGFQKTARHVAETFKQPWLWWEADATPLEAHWIAVLQAEYSLAGQPFMGYIVPGMGHMNGVGIYPPDVSTYTIRGMLAQKHPWDVSMRSETIRHTHPTQQIRSKNWCEYRNGQAVPRKQPSMEDIGHEVQEMRHAGVVLLHYCKDGRLIDWLRGQQCSVSATTGLSLTVVITNFQRPEFLGAAFQSCEQARIRRVVISTSGANDAVKAVHQRIREINPEAVIVSEDGDSGCNNNWLRGVEAVRTSHVHILHDDDLLCPDFGLVENQLSNQIGFIAWDGAKHGNGASGVHQVFDLPQGTHDAKMIMPRLLGPLLSVSPVSGCFQTAQMLDTLRECQKFGDEFVVRRGHLVGNDLMIWLRAAQRNQRFLYLKRPLISYGHHAESATCRDVQNHEGKLLPIYNLTRQHFLATLPVIQHCVERHNPRSKDEQRRVDLCVKSWTRLYGMGLMRPAHVTAVPRDSTVIGDGRRLPFLKDILKPALSLEVGIILLTNDDTLLHVAVPWILHETLARMDAVCSFRNSFMPGQSPDWKQSPHELAAHGIADDPGRDLFAFTPTWLKAHWDEIPDYLLGASDWDSTLALIIRRLQGGEARKDNWVSAEPQSELPRGYVHHEYHSAAWRGPMKDSPAQKYNHRLTIQWAEANGLHWRAEQVRKNGC